MSVTRLREPTHRSARGFLAALMIPLLALAAISCSDGGAKAKAKVVEIVVPAGTQAKLDRGELVDVMPAELYFKVGDVIRIRNDDSVDQYAGPYLVQAGQQFELKFGSPGKYGGLCNLSGGSTYLIVITE
jgi:plastocyanin